MEMASSCCRRSVPVPTISSSSSSPSLSITSAGSNNRSSWDCASSRLNALSKSLFESWWNESPALVSSSSSFTEPRCWWSTGEPSAVGEAVRILLSSPERTLAVESAPEITERRLEAMPVRPILYFPRAPRNFPWFSAFIVSPKCSIFRDCHSNTWRTSVDSLVKSSFRAHLSISLWHWITSFLRALSSNSTSTDRKRSP
mmetsp:Transcript_116251/g.335802  ORF Transcript_116251/g.335802 Transcript_116251/m.335802 type:complete len:200 (+) Transcript_116251:529-1128(+)